jgi:uncharacterized protein (DUF1800 family)
MVASAIRATNADVSDAFALSNQITKLGEPIYRKLEPTGYSNVNSEWVSSSDLLGRMNFALALAGNKVSGVHLEPMKNGATADAIARALLFRDATEQTRAAIQQSSGDKAPPPEAIAGLVLGSPDFQRR